MRLSKHAELSILELSKHAKQRILERTKLSVAEVEILLERTAYCQLGIVDEVTYVLFYDARGDECFVARIRGSTVVSVLCIWHRLPAQIRRVVGERLLLAESYFFDRAAEHMRATLRPVLDVYVCIRDGGDKGQIFVPAERAFRIDRIGYEKVSDAELLECAASDISRMVTRELSSYQSPWCAEVTLRKPSGGVVRLCRKSVRRIIRILPLYGVMHDAILHVSCGGDTTAIELGQVPVSCTFDHPALVRHLHERLETIVDTVEIRVAAALLLKVQYRIEVRNNQFNWGDAIPSISHVELRYDLERYHPSY
jgi:hypothetical protein